MREPGNKGITGQQPLGINRSFHYLVVKRLKSALKHWIWEVLELILIFFNCCSTSKNVPTNLKHESNQTRVMKRKLLKL